MDDITPRLIAKKLVPPAARPVMRRSMDGILPPGHRRREVVKQAVVTPFVVLLVMRHLRRRLRRRYRWAARLEYPVIAVVALAMAYDATIGQWLALVYAIIVLVFRIDSRQPLAGALLFLVAIPVFQVLGLATVSQNVAIYAYELLVIGVIAAIVEISKKPPEISGRSGVASAQRR